MLGDISRNAPAIAIADVMAIGMTNAKTTGARLIPAYGKKVGDWVTLGGLSGEAPVRAVSSAVNDALVERGARIPPRFRVLPTSGTPQVWPCRSSIIPRMAAADPFMSRARETFSASVSCSTASMVWPCCR